ncbi:PstS family phosphate ABC transporter substrate-binding protein [Pedobacter caeni]|uniref:Phosphate ABC transporter substrate-binding protein, PhoT family n=1 Tax=Pedobacter caeni TaxID=288992 RepID=A0A1M5P9X4_9SPHI|nr:substrate-binding domain-containing protein [Pedobacter caeni]SHG98631.1 phosphate ABC transporter substrate-binding protein, PhoT family [Pedobacter caeni]
MKHLSLILLLFVFVSCKRKASKENTVEQTRTSGSVKILVDESFSQVLADQIAVFKTDYPNSTFNLVEGNENKIVPTFLNDSTRVIILSRMLRPDEDKMYRNRSIVPKTSRFAIDGIALVTNAANIDSNITVQEVIDILKGTSTTGKQLVFDNAYSSTLRYFKDLAGIKELPKKGVYTLENNNDVIKYVADKKDFIGVVGVNWLISSKKGMTEAVAKVKVMGLKNLPGKKGDGAFYKPDQKNLITGIYPFLRNIYIINAEGREGLGTGFANWLVSQRGQLIVLKSGLGPHKMMPREFNFKNTN